MRSADAAQLSLPFDGPPVYEIVARMPRMRTCLGGKLVHGDGAYTIDCIIRDISPSGAKIILSRRQSLPHELYLIAVKYGVAHRATVAWSDYPARGLHFIETFPLSAGLPVDLRFLRHLWLELAARSGPEF